MKKIVVVLILFLLLFAFSGCEKEGQKAEVMITEAMIRYFDGSSEMLMLDHYEVGRCTFHLYTVDGNEIITSPYNAIIIKEVSD